MITEIAQIDVKPGMEAEFEAGVKKPRPPYSSAPKAAAAWRYSGRSKSLPAIGCLSAGKRWKITPSISAARPISRNGANWSATASPRRRKSNTCSRSCRHSDVTAGHFPGPETRPILGLWPEHPSVRARRRRAIRPDIQRRTRPGRHAPRRRVRMRRRSIRRWRNC